MDSLKDISIDSIIAILESKLRSPKLPDVFPNFLPTPKDDVADFVYRIHPAE